jgi:hypothetical protein
MEATVEQLLMIDGGGGDAAPAPPPASKPPASAPARRGGSAWRHPLPADFLVVPPQLQALAGPAPADAQMLADQQLAEMLQSAWRRAHTPSPMFRPRAPRRTPPTFPTPPPPHPTPARTTSDELFLSELMEDPEFVAYLRANPSAAEAFGVAAPVVSRGSARDGRFAGVSSAAGAGSGAGGGGNSIGGALASMGAALKSRFVALGATFKRKQTAGGAAAATPAAPNRYLAGGLGSMFGAPAAGSAGYAALGGGGGGGGGGGRRGSADEVEIELISSSGAPPAGDQKPATTATASWAAAHSINGGAAGGVANPAAGVKPSPAALNAFAISGDSDEEEVGLLRKKV